MSQSTENKTTDSKLNFNDCRNIITQSTILEFMTQKYMTALTLFNIILKNANLPEIHDITHFKLVSRDSIIDEKNVKEFEQLLPIIISQFGENECKLRQKKQIKNYIITILKSMCKQLTLTLVKKYKNVQCNHIVTSYVLYSVEYSKTI